jgi:hypothetical protein
MQNAVTVLDAQPRAVAEWSLESPVIGNGHAGFGRRTSEKDPQGHLADVPPHDSVRVTTAFSRLLRLGKGVLVKKVRFEPPG